MDTRIEEMSAPFPVRSPNERIDMDNQPETVREAVGVFAGESDLQAAIDELLSSGFHRAELSLLAGESAVNEKLGSGFASARVAEGNPAVPRTAYVSPEAIGDAAGAVFPLARLLRLHPTPLVYAAPILDERLRRRRLRHELTVASS